MSFRIIGSAYLSNGEERTDYACDSVEDLSDLPTTIGAGSTAICPDSTSGKAYIYMLTPSKIWAPCNGGPTPSE